ncbi:MAG: hypothetical protein H0X40_19355 [Chthoniobacterales bacterium]|nr:hypothetical protein [Chthoniobacterales bacterium]
MANPLPTNSGKISNLATKMYNGIVAKGAAIPVTMVTAAQMLSSKTAFKNDEATFNASRNALRNSYGLFKPAQKALYDWLVVVRTALAGRLGKSWSAAWAEAGFVAPSTAVPATIEGQIALGLSLVNYFTNNPTYEVPSMDVTATKGTALTDAAVSGQSSVATAEQALKTADEVRQPARTSLLDLMATLIANLDRKLAGNDPRWLAFGLQMPSTPTTPGKPLNVTATLSESGAIIVQCDPTPLATRYRGRMLIVGIQPKYQLAFSGPQPIGTITDVEPGVTVQIVMQAVNGSSQSVASDPVLFTMPATAKTAAEVKPAALLPELERTAAPALNGNGNGSHAVSRLT